jgi:hypothetical protein
MDEIAFMTSHFVLVPFEFLSECLKKKMFVKFSRSHQKSIISKLGVNEEKYCQ